MSKKAAHAPKAKPQFLKK
jgi:tRNA A-37 threonylcarbamoyl transferase component Bud32